MNLRGLSCSFPSDFADFKNTADPAFSLTPASRENSYILIYSTTRSFLLLIKRASAKIILKKEHKWVHLSSKSLYNNQPQAHRLPSSLIQRDSKHYFLCFLSKASLFSKKKIMILQYDSNKLNTLVPPPKGRKAKLKKVT